MNGKKAKDLTEWEPFSIKIEVKAIGLEILIHAKDPLDCVTLAGAVIAELRRLDKTPEVVILP